MFIGLLVAIAMIFVFGIAWAWGSSQTQGASWNEILATWADEHGFGVAENTPDSAAGDVGGIHVFVDRCFIQRNDNAVAHTRIKVSTDLPTDTILDTENTFSASVDKMMNGDDLRTGDLDFDRTVLLRGDEAELLARMTEPVREMVLAFVRSPAMLIAGMLVLKIEGAEAGLAKVTTELGPLLTLAKAVRLDGSVAKGLARNSVKDVVPGVRARNLQVLSDRYKGTKRTAAALGLGLLDTAPEVRLVAAEATEGPESLMVLEALVEDPTCEETVRVNAALALAKRSPGSAALPKTIKWLLEQIDGRSPSRAIIAAETLGAFAGLETVEPLLPHTRGIFKDGGLKDTATRAVAAIQARSGGVAGALSLVEALPGAGALSHAASDMSASKMDEDARS